MEISLLLKKTFFVSTGHSYSLNMPLSIDRYGNVLTQDRSIFTCAVMTFQKNNYPQCLVDPNLKRKEGGPWKFWGRWRRGSRGRDNPPGL